MKTVVQESLHSFVLDCQNSNISQTVTALKIRYEEQQVVPCRFCGCAVFILNITYNNT